MITKREIETDLSELNHSELVMLANWNGLKVSRAIPREVIQSLLEGLTPNTNPGPFDFIREELGAWMQRWWKRIQMQVPKKVCPNCSECREMQVLDCYLMNKENLGRR